MPLGFSIAGQAHRWRGASVLPPAISPLPQQAAIVARWSADAIAPQADNTALASWTDSVSGLAAAQATSAAQPKYRTGGAGGKPYVLFSGAQYLDAGAANAVATTCQTKTSSVLVVCRNVQASQYGYLFSASNVTGYCLFASGARVGVFTTGQISYSGAGLTTVGYTAGLPDQYSGRYYINGTCCSQIGALQSAAGHNVGIGGAPATPATAAKAEIYDVIVWNRALTAFEMMQAEKWAREKYSSPYPWAGGAFRVFHGDSLTAGYGMSARAEETYPAQVAAANGWPLGSWTNLGYVGTTMSVMRDAATAEIDPMLAVLGDTPMHLATWEWYNQRNATVAGQYGSTGITESYFRARDCYGLENR